MEAKPDKRQRQIAEGNARLAELYKQYKDASRQGKADAHSLLSLFKTQYDPLAMPGGLTKHLQDLDRHDAEAIEDTICYLEVDPVYFRSGYLKEEMLRRLKRCPLTAPQIERLWQCILRCVESGGRQFKYYARLAGHFPSSAGMASLESQATSADPEVNRRIRYLQTVIQSSAVASRINRIEKE